MYERISTYISYVVAPFHPFGGAVDIIVVRQQDGSFKSTPWYVRFGKFQGVLKRNEEIVTVAVNGVEANFHMYLDNTGQAHFLREVESDEEDESSDKSEDEAVTASRRESFKSAESRGDIEEQFDDRIGEYGDDEMEADQIRASLNSEALGGISMIHQSNGEILISFAEHSSNLSDKQIGNGLQNCAVESLSVNENGNGKPNVDVAFDNKVKLARSPKENVKAQQVSSTSHLDGELPNGNEEQNGHGHQESSKIESPFAKIGAVSETEFGGKVSENGWGSYKETSVFRMEGSSGTLDVSAGNTSSTDAFVVSGYNAYGYEHMNLPQSEDASDFRKVEDGNSEVVLMSGDGHVMTAPISSFKRSGSLNLHGPQLKTVTSQGGETQYVDKISSLRKVDHSFTDKHGEEITKSNDIPVKVASKDTPESIVRTLYGFSISECLLDSEEQSKRSGQFTDNTRKIDFQAETENHASEPKVDIRQIPRTESEMEFASNDEDVFKSCIALNELSSPTEEEDRQHGLSTHLEEEEEFNEERTHATQKESYSAAFQPGKPQASHVESSHPSESMHKSDRQSVGRSMSRNPGNQSKPINIPGPHTKGRGVRGQVTTSLPDMGFLSSSMETSVTQGLYSRSLDIDSSFCKRSVNRDLCPAKSENVEAETSDVYKLNDKDSSDKSLEPDVGTDVAISLCRDLLSKGMGAEAAAGAFDSKLVSREEFMRSGAEIIKNEKLIVRIRGRYYPWSAVSHVILGRAAFDLEVPIPGEPEGEICVECLETAEAQDNSPDSNISSSGRWRFWPFRRLKTPEKTASGRSASNVELSVDQEAGVQNPSDKELEGKNALNNPPQKRKVRTNTPTSEQLASLNLKEGLNMITFTFLTSIWGKQQVDARIHLWKWNTRIVISDVDGTITKSDVLGQVMPLVGKDWTQTGVARLFSAIKDNGYQILFLSARAITQAYLTRQFLLNLKQDGKALPDGPVMISPDGVVPSLYREVIRRAPHEFKIACLEDIRRLFPPECNPFYAGFGNRDTDEISYLKVGIPKGKIFIINPKGEVVVNHRVDVKSYTSLHKLANDMFPPMPSCEREDFNSWNYWKVPLPDIED